MAACINIGVRHYALPRDSIKRPPKKERNNEKPDETQQNTQVHAAYKRNKGRDEWESLWDPKRDAHSDQRPFYESNRQEEESQQQHNTNK